MKRVTATPPVVLVVQY